MPAKARARPVPTRSFDWNRWPKPAIMKPSTVSAMKEPGRGSKGVSSGPNAPTSCVASMRESILQPVTDQLQSVDATRENLGNVGYLAGESTALVSFLAAKLGKPVLVEGPAGVGKTELAKALSRATERKLIRLQCYEGLDESKALYEWNYRKQLLRIQIESADAGWDDVERELEIVKLHAPDLPDTVGRRLVEVIHMVRGLDLKKPPSIAESIDWARALLLLGADDIDKAVFERTMSIIVKHRTDLDVVAERVGVKLGNGILGQLGTG